MVVLMTFVLLFSFSFAIPAQAIPLDLMGRYFRDQGVFLTNANYQYGDFMGDQGYWKQMVEKGKWTGENRPEPLMGDANIDGKVNAVDALFALNFAVRGNVQTAAIAAPMKTSYHASWDGHFNKAYHEGTLYNKETSQEVWLNYCKFNSPFFADVTKDCAVNAKDALQILKYAVGKAKDFPVGDFTSISSRFSYYPWPTEYYPGFFEDHLVDMTDKEFCEKYNFNLDVSPTNQ